MGLPGNNEICKRRRHFDKLMVMVMVKEPTLSKDQAALLGVVLEKMYRTLSH